MQEQKLILDSQVPLDKRKIRIFFFAGMLVVMVAVAAMIWSLSNWEKYSVKKRWLFSAAEFDGGLAPTVFDWSLTLVVLIPVIFFLIWLTLDFKLPQLGINRQGLFINQKLFKRTLLTWDEIESVKKLQNGSLEIYFKNPSEIVNRQPAHYRYFLKTTYVKKGLPFLISSDMQNENIIALMEKYFLAHTKNQ